MSHNTTPAQPIAPQTEVPQGFIDYVQANYNGVIDIHRPEWHAKRLWNAAMHQIKVAQPIAPMVDESDLRDAVAESLRGNYYCGRVWSAWSFGTMSEADFSPSEEVDECIDQVMDAIRPSLAAQPIADNQAGTWLNDEQVLAVDQAMRLSIACGNDSLSERLSDIIGDRNFTKATKYPPAAQPIAVSAPTDEPTDEPTAWALLAECDPQVTSDREIADYWTRKGRNVTALYARAAAVSAPTDERVAFEAVARTFLPDLWVNPVRLNESYADKELRTGWEFWKAARAAAPVSGQGASELPPLLPKSAIGWKGQSMTELAYGHTDGAMTRYGQMCRSTAPSYHEFKNFHSNLCKRFGYVHDERDWKRDLVSLEEFIANLIDSRPRSEDSRAKQVAYLSISGANLTTVSCSEDFAPVPDGKYAVFALASTTPQKADNE